MTSNETLKFEMALQDVGLPKPKELIGKQIMCECPDGHIVTTILSVTNSGFRSYIELRVAPVDYSGKLVTHVVFKSWNQHEIWMNTVEGRMTLACNAVIQS